jgi:hypothetical protein
MESWRGYLNEQEDQSPQILSEGPLEQIRDFFSSAPDDSAYDPNGEYPENSYGAFAQSVGILSVIKKTGVQATKDNILKVAATALGTSTGKEKSKMTKGAQAAAGIALAIGGIFATPAIGVALTTAGIATAAWGAMQAIKKDPSKVEKFPLLQAFAIDEEYRDILDDDLEGEIEEKYKEFFEQKLASNPDETMKTLNSWMQDHIKLNHDNRTVVGHQAS